MQPKKQTWLIVFYLCFYTSLIAFFKSMACGKVGPPDKGLLQDVSKCASTVCSEADL